MEVPITPSCVVPQGKPFSRLSRITPMEVLVDPNFNIDDPAFKAAWLSELEKEWEKDWAVFDELPTV
jgi:hypothetical protein